MSWTSSYSVSNSSRKPLFSLAGSDAMRAESARRVAWSFFAEPTDMIDFYDQGEASSRSGRELTFDDLRHVSREKHDTVVEHLHGCTLCCQMRLHCPTLSI